MGNSVKVFGKKIAPLRLEHGWSQEELARRISASGSRNASKGAVARWEGMDVTGISTALLSQMAAAVGLPLDQLKKRIGAPAGSKASPGGKGGQSVKLSKDEVSRVNAVAAKWHCTFHEALAFVLTAGLNSIEKLETVGPAMFTDAVGHDQDPLEVVRKRISKKAAEVAKKAGGGILR